MASVLRAGSFDQSIGIGTHLTATSSAYGDVEKVIADIEYLDITHVRDRIIDTPYQAPFVALGKAGLSFRDLIVGGNPLQAIMPLRALAPYLNSVEGPNEVDRSVFSYDGYTGVASAIAIQKDLYTAGTRQLRAALHTRPQPSRWRSPRIRQRTATYTSYADYENVHAYGQYGDPSHWYLGPDIARTLDTPNRPVIVTETGNYTMPDHSSGVSETVQAKLVMDTLLQDFMKGVARTYIYQLLDANPDPGNTDIEEHYGLFHNDGTPKVAATAIHNLTTIVADNTNQSQSFATHPLSYSVTGTPSSSYQFAMEKSDGTYDLVLWWEPLIWNTTTNSEVTFASKPVTVTLGTVYQSINVYDPLAGTAPIATYHNVYTINVALNTGPLIIELVPNTGDSARPVYQHRYQWRRVCELRPGYDCGWQRRHHRKFFGLSDHHRFKRQPGREHDR